jgi:hypothetical protein
VKKQDCENDVALTRFNQLRNLYEEKRIEAQKLEDEKNSICHSAKMCINEVRQEFISKRIKFRNTYIVGDGYDQCDLLVKNIWNIENVDYVLAWPYGGMLFVIGGNDLSDGQEKMICFFTYTTYEEIK